MIRPKDKPWYSNHLRNMKRRVIRLFKKAKITQNEELWEKYHKLNNDYHEAVSSAKNHFEIQRNEKLKDKCHKSPKIWWKTVKEVLGYCRSSMIPSLIQGTSLISDNLGKAELLNNFFPLTAILIHLKQAYQENKIFLKVN
jgi:hypothetical protein